MPTTKAAAEHLDASVKQLSDKGVVVYLILLQYASGDPARDRLLLHPNYARGKKETGPIAHVQHHDARVDRPAGGGGGISRGTLPILGATSWNEALERMAARE